MPLSANPENNVIRLVGTIAPYTFTKIWNDGGYAETRPANAQNILDYWNKTLKLMPQASATLDTSRLILHCEETRDTTGYEMPTTWTYTVYNLPMFDGDSGEMVAYYVEELDPVYRGEKVDTHFQTERTNTGNHSSEKVKLYHNSTSTTTRTGTTTFQFQKHWQDGKKYDAASSGWVDQYDADTARNPRPKVTFSLYRFADDPSETSNFDNASPVPQKDKMTVDEQEWRAHDAEQDQWIPYMADSDAAGVTISVLDRYDPQGREYVHFIHEQLALTQSDAKDYEKIAPETDYILNNQTIINRLVDTITVTATKEWRTPALQSLKRVSTLGLLRQSADAPGKWTLVTNADGTPVSQTLTFDAETLVLTAPFSGLPKYDEAGNLYTYRVVELEMEVEGASSQNENKIQPTYSVENQPGSEKDTYSVSLDNRTYIVSYPQQEDGSYHTVVNSVEAYTKLTIAKIWNTPLPEGTTGTITLKLSRMLDGCSDVECVNPFVLSKTDLDTTNFPKMGFDEKNPNTFTAYDANNHATNEHIIGRLLNLPVYCQHGYAYLYYVDETECTTDPSIKYSLQNISYSDVEPETDPNHRKAVITNITGPGEALVFKVKKIWKDDGDLLCRETVTFHLYYKPSDDAEAIEIGDPYTLTESNQWMTEIRRAAYNSDTDYSHYFIKETHVGSNKVEYPVDANFQGSAPVTGEVATAHHVYIVTLERNSTGTNNEYTFTNRRIGTVIPSVKKEWTVGDMLANAPSFNATFALYVDVDGVPTQIDANSAYAVHAGNKYYDEGLLPSRMTELADDSFQMNYTETDDAVSQFGIFWKYDKNGKAYDYSIRELSFNGRPFVNGEIVYPKDATGNQIEYKVVSVQGENAIVNKTRHIGDTLTQTITNVRANTQELYVYKVWRDPHPDALNAPDRPDIVLDVVRTDADGLNPVKISYRSWSTDLNENPWLWKCSFGEQPLYDENGDPYTYTVTERITTPNSIYTTSYYPAGGEEWKPPVKIPTDENGALSAYTSEDVFSAMHTAQENLPTSVLAGYNDQTAGVIVNTCSESTYRTAYKEWQNMPGSFSSADWPVVQFKLQSCLIDTYDISTGQAIITGIYQDVHVTGIENPITVSAPSKAGQKVVEVQFGDAFSHTLPLYDAYGRQYDYKVVETYTGNLDNNLEFTALYETTAATNNGLRIINKFKSPTVIFSVDKQWDLTEYFTQNNQTSARYPSVTFTLTQTWSASDAEPATYTLTLPSGTVSQARAAMIKARTGAVEVEENPQSVWTASDGTTSASFPIYAPDGSYFSYEITEQAGLGGYQQQVADGADGWKDLVPVEFALNESTQANDTLTAFFKNTYDHGGAGTETVPTRSFTITKQWAGDSAYTDANGTHLLRPSTDEMAAAIGFTVYRRIGTTGDFEEVTGDIQASWVQMNGNWVCTLTAPENVFPTYSTWSTTPYTYYVAENLSATYRQLYASNATAENPVALSGTTATVTNTLQTVDLTASKQWLAQTGTGADPITEPMNTEQVFAYAALLNSGQPVTDITLTLKLAGADAGTVALLAQWSDAQKTVTATFTQDGTLVVKNGESVSEVLFAGLPRAYKSATGEAQPCQYKIVEMGMTVNDKQVSGFTGASTTGSANNGQVALTLTNTLTSVKVELHKAWVGDESYTTDRPSAITVTVTDNGSNATYIETLQASAWTLTRYYPRNTNGYTVSESVAGYTTTYSPQASFTGNAAVTITNTFDPMTITATKVWVDTANSTTITTQPESITFRLKRDGMTVGEKNVMKNADGTWPTAEWTGLPAYTGTGSARTLIAYQVEEITPAGYSSAITPTSLTKTAPDATATNTLNTVSVRCQKKWDGGVDATGISVTFMLQYSTDNGANWASVGTTAEATVTAATNWSAEWSGLPTHTGDGKAILYHVKETGVDGFTAQDGGASTSVDAADIWENDSDKMAELTIVNAQNTITIYGQKVWAGDNDLTINGVRPESVQLQLYQRIGSAEDAEWTTYGTAQTISESTMWIATWSGLPTHSGAERTPIFYKVDEATPAGYTQTAVTPSEINAAALWNDADNKAQVSATVVLTNTLDPQGVVGQKVWEGNATNIPVETRVSFRLFYSVDKTNWHNAKVPDQTVSATPWLVSWQGLPTHDGNGSPLFYRVEETDVPKGHTSAQTGDLTVTNTLCTTSVRVEKTWSLNGVNLAEDHSSIPNTLTLTLKYRASGSTAEPQTVQINGADAVITLEKANVSDHHWQAAWNGLPMYTAVHGVPVLIEYCVEETWNGQTQRHFITVTPDDNTAKTLQLTNFLSTLSLSGKKTWVDSNNVRGMRPDGITLTVRANGETVNPQPSIVWDSRVNDDEWPYHVDGLPVKDERGVDITYTIRESDTGHYVAEAMVNGQLTLGDTASGFKDASGNLTGLDFVNSLDGYICIDNQTENPNSSQTNAGGVVQVGGSTGGPQPDDDQWQKNAMQVRWRSNPNWLCAPEFTVEYLEYGETAYRSVTVNENNLTALRVRFPQAYLQFLDDGTRHLVLAESLAGMPAMIRIYVRFLPTIAVENTTENDANGMVSIEGTQYSSVGDGLTDRPHRKTVYAKADDGYVIDMENLQLGPVGSVHNSWDQNTLAKTLRLNALGRFTTQINAEVVAGTTEMVTIHGVVTVLESNLYGEPTHIKIEMDELPACLDIGVPFVPMRVALPQTGDNSHIALWGAMLMLSAAGLFIILNKRRLDGTR